MRRSTRALTALFVAFGVAIGFGIRMASTSETPVPSAGTVAQTPLPIAPASDRSAGYRESTVANPDQVHTELLVIFVGSSSCTFSDPPELKELLGSATAAVSLQAVGERVDVYTVGFAVDEPASVGASYLTEVGVFDEIVTGRGWDGVFGDLVLGQRLGAVKVTPQLLIVDRDRARASTSESEFTLLSLPTNMTQAFSRA